MTAQRQDNELYDPAGDGLYPDRLTTHNYDGIQEYDNPMPLWWKAIFAATVVWAVVYVAGTELGYINTYEESLAEEMAVAEEAEFARMAARPPLGEEQILAAIDNEDLVARGEEVFTAQCGPSCHGVNAEGYIGPNLTDNYWLYQGTKLSIYESIANGRPNGMPAWGSILGRDDTLAVTAYVESLRGTDLEGPKGAQGDLFDPAAQVPAEGAPDEAAPSEPAPAEPAPE